MFRVTQPYLNLLVKPRIFSGFLDQLPKTHLFFLFGLTLFPPLTTNVFCFYPLMYFGSLYYKQYGPTAHYSLRSSLIRVHIVCFHVKSSLECKENMQWMADMDLYGLEGIGVAPITQLCRCLIKIVTFKGGHQM